MTTATRSQITAYAKQHPLTVYFVLTFLFTWLYQQTQGSLLLATLFHGAVNALGVMNAALGPAEWRWLLAAVYCVAALVVVIATRGSLCYRGSKQVYSINSNLT